MAERGPGPGLHASTPAPASPVADVEPVRLPPGVDLRHALENLAARRGGSAFVISGIGSLTEAHLRYAGEPGDTRVAGPLEIISLAGSLSPSGVHLHMAVSDAAGRVVGGHVGLGNPVRTTAELLLAWLPAWSLSRELDPATGFKELVVRPKA